MSALEELSRTILLCRDYVLDAVSDEDICLCLQAPRVLCVSDLRNLSSHSGQTALLTLVSLLSRMGLQVHVEIPEIAMLLPQPPLSGPFLRQALVESSETLITGSTVQLGRGLDPELVFVLGDTNFEVANVLSWRLYGSDWFGALTSGGNAQAWTAEWPVGGMVSAALAANEAFKFVMRRLPLRQESDEVYFELSRSCAWDFGPVPVPVDGLDIGKVDFISAGAISQAALYSLLRLPRLRMSVRVFDDDVTDLSNLNRNMLTVTKDVGLTKVQVIARHCGSDVRVEPVATRFEGEFAESGVLSGRVLVGVDDIPSRWVVQRHAPSWLAVSGTSHFGISSSVHTLAESCSGCLHPIDDDAGLRPIPTLSYVSFWAGLAMAVRLVREAIGHPYPRDWQQLWLIPLRMEGPHAAIWSPVAARQDCPVQCVASQTLREGRQVAA
jgi:molybdopterin/thiamine biosynthesis adenylyltransferase